MFYACVLCVCFMRLYLVPLTALPALAFAHEGVYECPSIVDDVARLECFDTATYAQAKTPLDLSKTLRTALDGAPALVLAPNALVRDSQMVQTIQDGQVDAVLTDLGASREGLATQTPLALAFDLERNSERGLFSARPHNPMYILPLYVNAHPNRAPSTPTQSTQAYTKEQMQNTELQYQFSVKTKMAQDVFDTNADLWFGYTQKSHWQVYNEDESRPFRATDYEPEVFLTQPVRMDLPGKGAMRMLGAGFVHHSNGESDPLSRSWNRAYLMAGAEWGKLTVLPRVWARVSAKTDGKKDDNPDILDYYGYGDVRFLYQLDGKKSISGIARYNPKTQNGALQLDYVYPLKKNASGYIQLFHGHAPSIVDYNHKTTTIGAGVMLSDWMGL